MLYSFIPHSPSSTSSLKVDIPYLEIHFLDLCTKFNLKKKRKANTIMFFTILRRERMRIEDLEADWGCEKKLSGWWELSFSYEEKYYRSGPRPLCKNLKDDKDLKRYSLKLVNILSAKHMCNGEISLGILYRLHLSMVLHWATCEECLGSNLGKLMRLLKIHRKYEVCCWGSLASVISYFSQRNLILC